MELIIEFTKSVLFAPIVVTAKALSHSEPEPGGHTAGIGEGLFKVFVINAGHIGLAVWFAVCYLTMHPYVLTAFAIQGVISLLMILKAIFYSENSVKENFQTVKTGIWKSALLGFGGTAVGIAFGLLVILIGAYI